MPGAWRAASVTAVGLILVGSGGIAWSEQRLDSGIAALLGSSMPLWIALLDRAVFGSRLSSAAILGLGVGLGGVSVLVGPSGNGGIDTIGVAAILVSSLGWAAGSLYARSSSRPGPPLQAAGMQMLAGGAMLGVAGVATGELGRLGAVSATSLGALAYLVVVGSLVAYPLYGWLLRSAPTKIVSTHAYVNPAVAVLLGWALLGERLSPATLVAGLAILASVVLIVTARAGRKREQPLASDFAGRPQTLRLGAHLAI